MIKNALLAGTLVLAACRAKAPIEKGAYQGIVEYEEVVLSFEVPGRVRTIDVQRGDVIAAGRTVATLDDSLARLGLEGRQSEVNVAEAQTALVKAGAKPEEIRAMEAQVAAARAEEERLSVNLARDEGLGRAGAKPPAEVEDLRGATRRAVEQRAALEHQLKALKQGARAPEVRSASERAKGAAAAAALEQSRLDRYRLAATAPGTVLDRHLEPGEVAAAGAPVVTLADTKRPFAEVLVPEGELPRVAVGERASLRIDGLAEPVAGRVEHVSRQAEFTPRYLFSERERPNLVFRVRVRFDDPGQKLRAGLPAFVTLTP